MTLAAILFAIVFAPMILEARRSNANDRVLRAAGAIEPPGDVHAVMALAYPASFLAMIAEAAVRGRELTPIAVGGFGVFVLAKLLKYWAIGTLGRRWTFRVLVPPDSTRVVSGPYQFVAHPNYVAVVGELIGAALIAGAWIAGPLATAGFGALMLQRIRVEERALRMESSTRRTQ